MVLQTGMFTVRSAYKLVVDLGQQDTRQEGCSERPDDPYTKVYGQQKFCLKCVCLHGDWLRRVSLLRQTGRKEPLSSMPRVRFADRRKKLPIMPW
jgi:hypothetical protein